MFMTPIDNCLPRKSSYDHHQQNQPRDKFGSSCSVPKDVPYLVCLCHTVPSRRPKFRVSYTIGVRTKIEIFHRGCKIKFTKELLLVMNIPTANPPTYTVKDSNNEVSQGEFYEPELVNLIPPHNFEQI